MCQRTCFCPSRCEICTALPRSTFPHWLYSERKSSKLLSSAGYHSALCRHAIFHAAQLIGTLTCNRQIQNQIQVFTLLASKEKSSFVLYWIQRFSLEFTFYSRSGFGPSQNTQRSVCPWVGEDKALGPLTTAQQLAFLARSRAIWLNENRFFFYRTGQQCDHLLHLSQLASAHKNW